MLREGNDAVPAISDPHRFFKSIAHRVFHQGSKQGVQKVRRRHHPDADRAAGRAWRLAVAHGFLPRLNPRAGKRWRHAQGWVVVVVVGVGVSWSQPAGA